MTVSEITPLVTGASAGGERRFRLTRAGILNVWQYDDQVFEFAGGRLLLRGANGAGKSKTLEMLLPFAIDGDKARITASAKHHTSLLWLMTDGLESGNRVGYVWVEFGRATEDGAEEHYTCGVGLRASTTARQATAWHFATPRRVGHDLDLEDAAGPRSAAALREALGDECVFDRAAEYKAHVGRALFGLDPAGYDEVLRLLYWLRQPQVGEDIEPVKLAGQLAQALPQLDEQTVRVAGDTFDELTAFGEQIERRSAAADALATLAAAYSTYARAVVAARALAVAQSLRQERRLRSAARAADAEVERLQSELTTAESSRATAAAGVEAAVARLRALEDSPEFRDQRRLDELAERSAHEDGLAAEARERGAEQQRRFEALVARLVDHARAVTGRLSQLREGVRTAEPRLRELVPDVHLPIPRLVDEPVLDESQGTEPLLGGIDELVDSLDEARAATSRRLAVLRLVRTALEDVRRLMGLQRAAERDAEQAERRWESARSGRIEAEEGVEVAAAARFAAVTEWVARPAAPGTAAGLAIEPDRATPEAARSAAAPHTATLRDALGAQTLVRDRADAEVEGLEAERQTVLAEREVAPPAPSLARTPRPDGHPLWRVVDFAPGVAAADRVAAEAALQSAGLLDAWLRPGGVLLGPDDRDVVISAPVGAPVTGGLAELLVPDLPPGTDLHPDDVRRVLACLNTIPDPTGPGQVSTDGSWRLGPLHGRAAKERVQFIGATARAEERARRLHRIEALLNEHRGVAAGAAIRIEALEAELFALADWVAAVPSTTELVSARTVLAERAEVAEREEQANRAAQQAAHQARVATSQSRARLDALAASHGLVGDESALDAVEQGLLEATDRLRDLVGGTPATRQVVLAWGQTLADRRGAGDVLDRDVTLAAQADQRAQAVRAELEALRDSVGDSVEQLQRRVGQARHDRQRHEEAQTEAQGRVESLIESGGRAKEAASQAGLRVAEHVAQHQSALTALVAVTTVPGLLSAAGAAPEHADVIESLTGLGPDGTPSRAAVGVIEELGGLSADDPATAAHPVWRAHGEAGSGPAADHQLTVSEHADLLAVSGRDEAGEATVDALAQRVRGAVARDRGLLTEREKEQFEQHVLGELGDAIRQRRADAEELVTAMNDQLRHVTTSQGIRVRLDWRLRDDVPAEARAAVELLAQPVGALIPEERAQLRDVLHRLIEASRAERPELSYGEHLGAALDYRTWSQFSIRYSRPEKPGQWERLHRRSPLSQGEQKVLCYLPLFAAAAAHFTSLAGAAPHAPRLVLLDDAFPKIDVRTHPLLFGLLVQLDLDFVITSERLWGDHATVPALAIYEALRDPGQRGIAQYAYRWDGRVLQGIG